MQPNLGMAIGSEVWKRLEPMGRACVVRFRVCTRESLRVFEFQGWLFGNDQPMAQSRPTIGTAWVIAFRPAKAPKLVVNS